MGNTCMKDISSSRNADTEFHKAKILRAYHMADIDGDGKVLENDFVTWGKMASEKAKVEFTDERKKLWLTAYQAYYSAEGTSESPEKHYQNICAFLEVENSKEIATQINASLFACIDADGSGDISINEYRAFIYPLGITSEEDVQFGFNAIDKNKDGVLSKEEVGEACYRYYYDKKDTPFKHFYGKYDNTNTTQEEK
mmetsp:Transcript_23562/g.33056  ORF Transcript_23562/g.33056 Transcript_23562/m.33056 type:complete len:197 (+) Transcript_23562:50-640(+)